MQLLLMLLLPIKMIRKKAGTPDVTQVYDDDKEMQLLLMLLLSMKMKHMSLKHGIQEQLFVKYVL